MATRKKNLLDSMLSRFENTSGGTRNNNTTTTAKAPVVKDTGSTATTAKVTSPTVSQKEVVSPSVKKPIATTYSPAVANGSATTNTGLASPTMSQKETTAAQSIAPSAVVKPTLTLTRPTTPTTKVPTGNEVGNAPVTQYEPTAPTTKPTTTPTATPTATPTTSTPTSSATSSKPITSVSGGIGKDTTMNQYEGGSGLAKPTTTPTAKPTVSMGTVTTKPSGSYAPTDSTITTKPFESGQYQAPTAPTTSRYEANPYVKSEAVLAAEQKLEQMASPGSYESKWQDQLNDAINKILNREQFEYDINADALYSQYKDKYTQAARMAMEDTMGQAAAMTGGYGNSYAAAVGNQAYAQQMQNLNDVIPELYQMAYDRYNDEGQRMLDHYGILANQENLDYGRFRDEMSDYLNERNYLAGRLDTERNFDYGQYADDRNFSYGQYVDDRNFDYSKYVDDRNFGYGQYVDDRNFGYQTNRDAVSDEMWQKEFDEAIRQFDKSYEYKQAAARQETLQDIADDITDKGFETNEEVNGYIDNLVQNGVITEEEGEAIKNSAQLPPVEMTETENTANFIARYPTKDSVAFGIDLETAIEGLYNDGALTEEEVAYLLAYYGI